MPILDLPGVYGADVRPPRDSEGRKPWAKNPSGPDADDGTRLDATVVNDLIGMIRGIIAAAGIAANAGDDNALAAAVVALIGATAPATHTHSMDALQDGSSYVRMTTAERVKLAALVTNYQGAFADLAALAAAYPEGQAGDWAILSLPGEPASIAVWDADAEPPAWVDIDNAPPQTAATLAFAPAGTLGSTNVQAAIEELAAESLSVEAAQSFSAAQVAQARRNLRLSTGPLSGFRNKIINGDGRINQRVASAVSDGQYGHDRHYALTESAGTTVSTETAPADGIAAMMRLTQSDPTAQRMGYAQIVEAAETYGLRGQTVTLGGKLRYSNAAAVRFAVLEWTGPADAVTSDVINDWASGSYTAGGFFIGANLTVAAVGSITPQADAITDWSITANISSSANNLIVLFWTEATAAQASTLDMRWYLVESDATADVDPFSPRHIGQELDLCQRYFQKSYDISVAPGTADANGKATYQMSSTSGNHFPSQRPLRPMRTVPSMTISSPSTGDTGKVRNESVNADVDVTAVSSTGRSSTGVIQTAAGTADHQYSYHYTADAEL